MWENCILAPKYHLPILWEIELMQEVYPSHHPKCWSSSPPTDLTSLTWREPSL